MIFGVSGLEMEGVLKGSLRKLGRAFKYHTDGLPAYPQAVKKGVGGGSGHGLVCHKEGFVSEEGVHENNVESFWSVFRPWLLLARVFKETKNFHLMLKAYAAYYNTRSMTLLLAQLAWGIGHKNVKIEGMKTTTVTMATVATTVEEGKRKVKIYKNKQP